MVHRNVVISVTRLKVISPGMQAVGHLHDQLDEAEVCCVRRLLCTGLSICTPTDGEFIEWNGHRTTAMKRRGTKKPVERVFQHQAWKADRVYLVYVTIISPWLTNVIIPHIDGLAAVPCQMP